jgi:hypothetical protein
VAPGGRRFRQASLDSGLGFGASDPVDEAEGTGNLELKTLICIPVRTNLYSIIVTEAEPGAEPPEPRRSQIVLPVFLPLGSDNLGDPAGSGEHHAAAREDGSGMSRVYGEPVNVQARDDGRPVRFVWRGRLYTVRAILEHWLISREWWQDPEAPEAEAGQPELEFWRIEAVPGPGVTPGVYELRRETATGVWTLRLGMV